MRLVNEAGIDLIKSFEGLFLKPYLDPVNIPTIGFGTIKYPNGKAVTMQDPAITEIQATEYLMHEVEMKASAVEKIVKVPLNDNEYAALVSFSYNVGSGALQSSTLLKMLNAGADRKVVADQFLRWNKAGGKELPGLTRRRQAERSLFLQPILQEEHLPSELSEEEINQKLEDIEKDILK